MITLWLLLISALLLLFQVVGGEEVKIGTLHGKLRFDPEIIVVPKGAKINLLFENQDEMIHNLLIAKGDSKHIDGLAKKALDLGARGMDLGFIPEDPSIIASIGLVQPGETAKVSFGAPDENGDYPFVCTFPGHALSMRGIMKVVEDPSLVKAATSPEDLSVKKQKNGAIQVGSLPRVVRVHFAGVDSGRSIAVGLPSGYSYLFDAEKLNVRMGWKGGFINVNNDRRGRGGGLCSIIGKRYASGIAAFPIRIGDPTKVPETRFLGYSRAGNPTFYYEVDGIRIEQSTTGSPPGKELTHNFKVAKQKDDVFFLFDPEKVQLSSTTAGKREKGTLRVHAKDSANFVVSLTSLDKGQEGSPEL
ncbi:MAG: plastocyanin/azurin family copper-binding protein [Opitutae bacterium]